MGNIIVYRASAGSGKTYTLVYQYLKYLFLAQKPFVDRAAGWVHGVHRGVLAVTFTNKATSEMKSRILEALYLLGQEAADDGVAVYKDWLLRDMAVTDASGWDKTVRVVANRLLADILSDYTSFRVMTIDGFFQQVVRAFANEFNLNANYKVELNSDVVVESAVDEVLDSLDDKDNKKLLEWLTAYVDSRVGDSDSWNPRRNIIKMSDKLLQERNKNRTKSDDDVADTDINRQIAEYKDAIVKLKNGYESRLRQLCSDADGVFAKFGLNVANSDDYKLFSNNTISCLSFDYLKGKNFIVASTAAKINKCEDPMGYYFTQANRAKAKKNNFRLSESEMDAIAGLLKPIQTEIVDLCCGEKSKEYQTAVYILKNIYILGITSVIEERIDKMCREQDTMLLASTTSLIGKIIDGSDTPFIYERVGMRTNHYMIDEFQDTSKEQWLNFVPLFEEAVGKGYENMIVGDIKQSIYRWRNGDWRILYEGVKTDIAKSNVVDMTLDTNFRSMGNVVRYNNCIYSHIPQMVDSMFQTQYGEKSLISFSDVYSSAQQKIKPANDGKGYVRTSFMSSGSKKELYGKSIADVIGNMKLLGSYDGVAVLARVNDDLIEIAAELAKENIPFCSLEALAIADNVAVKFIIAVMRYLTRPYEKLYRAEMLNAFFILFFNRFPAENEYRYIAGPVSEKTAGEEGSGIDGDGWLGTVCADIIIPATGGEVTAEQFVMDINTLRFMPLNGLINRIVELFGIARLHNNSHLAYIKCLSDELYKYMSQHRSDIVDFLDYWGKKSRKMYLPISETGNRVMLSTIHRSKGLEYKTVFLPFVDIELGIANKTSYAFVKAPSIGAFADMPKSSTDFLVPINMQNSKRLINTLFRQDVIEEYFNYCLDNLNIFYVATTRAKCNLFVNFLKIKKKKNSDSASKQSSADNSINSILLSDLVRDILSRDIAAANELNLRYKTIDTAPEQGSETEPQEADEVYEMGELVAGTTPVVGNGNRCRQEQPAVDLKGNNRPLALKFRHKAGDNTSLKQLRYGTMMHNILAGIYHLPTDNPSAVDTEITSHLQRAVAAGTLPASDLDAAKQKILSLFGNDKILDLFSDKYQVVNEGEIWDNDSKRIFRPDRLMLCPDTKTAIVVDYKLGERTDSLHAAYTQQVEHYIRLAKALGYTTAKGYLLYISTAELVEIRPQNPTTNQIL